MIKDQRRKRLRKSQNYFSIWKSWENNQRINWKSLKFRINWKREGFLFKQVGKIIWLWLIYKEVDSVNEVYEKDLLTIYHVRRVLNYSASYVF